jgi:fermentation-respiration switch protein FrsA (DUF1100 family)
VPVLVMHGDDDQIVPYADSGPLSAQLVQNGTLKTYKGFPHGMPTTNAETIDADLLTSVHCPLIRQLGVGGALHLRDSRPIARVAARPFSPRPASRRGSSLLNDCGHGCGLRDIDRMAGRNLLHC